MANTTESMKVIVTKQGEEGEAYEIIDEAEYGQVKKKHQQAPSSERTGRMAIMDDINVVGTVLNEGSEVNLSIGKLGISQSAQKVQLP